MLNYTRTIIGDRRFIAQTPAAYSAWPGAMSHDSFLFLGAEVAIRLPLEAQLQASETGPEETFGHPVSKF